MALFEKLRHRWAVARNIADAEDAGQILVVVPAALAAEVASYVWRRKVETASDRWVTDEYDVPLEKWQAAMSEIGRHRKGKPRDPR